MESILLTLIVAFTPSLTVPTGLKSGLECEEATVHFNDNGIMADNFRLDNCEGGRMGLCFKAEVGNVTGINFTGQCLDGWCSYTLQTDLSEPWVNFNVNVPNGYYCVSAQLIPTLDPDEAGVPQVCISGFCPSSTFEVTGWTAIPYFTACYIGGGEPGGGQGS
ncbi:MAG: hypothetical protein WD716_11275 [Fimbriimonadaceae bacterium]